MTLVVLGYGYSSAAFVAAVRDRFARVVVTVRGAEKAARLAAQGLEVCRLGPDGMDPALPQVIGTASAVLSSIPPDSAGDPVLARPALAAALTGAAGLRWVGYLSTVGVYGDHGGGWVDEDTPVRPVSPRSVQRVAAEQAWQALGAGGGPPVHIFRLAGIYGPGQNALANLADGTARRIVKPGQVFNRIHVEDIAGALAESLQHPQPGGAVYNVTDDEPAAPQDVVAYAATLLGVPVPPDLPFASAELSPMARSFYGENKRVSNARLRALGWVPRYPTYREALAALLAAGEGRR